MAEVTLGDLGEGNCDDIDILSMRDRIAVQIRGRKLSRLMRFDDYVYDGLTPIVNGRGFAVLAKTDDEIREFIREFDKADETTLPDLSVKWLRFDTYRQIYISGMYI